MKTIMLIKRLTNRGARPFGINPFPRSFENPLAQKSGSAREVFDGIYLQNFWGSGESRSGIGSERNFTHRYSQRLATVVKQFSFRRFFDAPCGDLNWIPDLVREVNLDYCGGDISPLVVSEVKAWHAEFDVRLFDIITDRFPRVDVWHCRDCFFHLPIAAIKDALRNFSESSIPYALITSHRARFMHQNLDVGFGGFRFLDLEWPPFGLPQPVLRIPDYRRGIDFPRYVCLWTREQIQTASESWLPTT